MKAFLFLLFILVNSYAQEFVKSNTCKGCHPTIYAEFYNSSHRKASTFEDKIHNAVWNLHPLKQEGTYSCAKCHTPTDLKLLNKLKEKKEALPVKNEVQTQEAISCAYCHSIQDVEKHSKMNENIVTLKAKYFIQQMKIIGI